MKGQVKRFLDHQGKAYDIQFNKKTPVEDNIGFLDLWRYSTWVEAAATVAGVVLGVAASLGLIGAVLVYGELTSLFVQRHTAAATPPSAHLLRLFGGGRTLPAGNRNLHMDALLEDATAFGLASLAIMVVQMLAATGAVSFATWASTRMVTRIRLRLLRSLITQEMAFFDTNTTVNFATTLTEDMEKLREGCGGHVAMTSYLAGTVVCGGAVALAYGWQLTLAGMAVVPLSIAVATIVSNRQTRWSAREVEAYGVAGRLVEQALAGVRTVRAFAGEAEEVRRYREALGGASRAVHARGLWAGTGAGLGWLLTYSLNSVVFAYGAALCVRDRDLPPDQQEYHPGVMVTVLFCTFMAAHNVTMCQPRLEVFSAARGAAKAVYRMLEKKSQINALEDSGQKPEKFKGNIIFDNVYFSYPSRPEVKVLRGLSLKIKAGETVALVGSSGCGKSTVLQLLQRLYESDAGCILIDGHRLQDLDLHHYRTKIGVVGQEPVLFSGTIRENITLGIDNVSDEEVIRAAETAHAHHFISQLPKGYDTMLGERGASLSGGQKQRVAIARAVLRRPALLLLDEPTSALDPAAERQVQAALDAASKGRTTLVVSHRLSTIVNATRIVLVEQGAIVESGSHAELMARRGAFWRLVQEDMTTKSIATTLPLVTDEEEMPNVAKDENIFRRSYIRQYSNVNASFSGTVRGSRRMGAMTATMPEMAVIAPREEEEEQEEEPRVSSLELIRLQAPEWQLLAGGGIAAFLVGATMPAFAFLFSKLYGMFAWPDSEAILRESRIYAGLFLGVAALCGVVTFLQTWLFNRAGARLTERLRERTFAAFLRQEQAWFDNAANSVGALCARLATDCAAVQGATGTRLGTVLQGISTMVLGIGLAMMFSWKMTLVSLLSVPCVIGGIFLEGFVNKRAEVRDRRALERASRLATEATLNVRTVQSLGVESIMLMRYNEALREASANAGRWLRGPVYGLCLCAPTLGYAVSLVYAGYLIAREDLQYEYAILVSEALIYGAWMLAEALSFAPSFAAARRSGARILALLAREPKIVTEPTAHEIPDWKAEGEVSLTDVGFRYPGRGGEAVLQNLSLHLEAGQTLALVGASGCGKSTVLQLLLRNYDCDKGRAALDGRDVRRDLTLPQLRAQYGLVQQEPVLFERTIRENIAYGDTSREVPLDEIVQAAKQANVHNFIVGLPLGYDTVVGGGAALSGGQKQRVAIARALVRRPRVLLLDEATSALDAAGERQVQAALEAAARGRTTVVIAHRLATVRHAHRIAVLAAGRVAEAGTHDELVARRGLYWQLLQDQAPASTP